MSPFAGRRPAPTAINTEVLGSSPAMMRAQFAFAPVDHGVRSIHRRAAGRIFQEFEHLVEVTCKIGLCKFFAISAA